MYTIRREVEEDPLFGRVEYMLENMSDLIDVTVKVVPMLISKYTSKYDCSNLAKGVSLRYERTMEGEVVTRLSFSHLTDDRMPIHMATHVFKDPMYMGTKIRVYGENTSDRMKVAERMGAVGKPIEYKIFEGISRTLVIDELDSFTETFIKDLLRVVPKNGDRPVVYQKPKTPPPTSPDFKGYKRWQR